MAYKDARGEQTDLHILASAGVNEAMTARDSAGTSIDLTGYTVTVTLKDDRPQARDYGAMYDYSSAYIMTVTDAASGAWTFRVPPDEFANKEGGEMTWEGKAVSGSDVIAIGWGYVYIQDRG